jgi:hypothetical protein
MGNRQLLRIGLFGLESIAVAEDQHIEVTGVDVIETAVTHGLAVGPIAMHGLVLVCHEPFHDGSSFWFQVKNS